jgi:hypothetical protein
MMAIKEKSLHHNSPLWYMPVLVTSPEITLVVEGPAGLVTHPVVPW